MGSYDSAVMVGFVCRLCSELNTNVIHIYSDKGIHMKLAEKIKLMPINLEPFDRLPKTVCRSCITQLNNQYNLIKQLENSRKRILEERYKALKQQEQEKQATTQTKCAPNNDTSYPYEDGPSNT